VFSKCFLGFLTQNGQKNQGFLQSPLESDFGEQLGPKSGHLAISLPKAAFYEVGFRPFGTKNGLFGSKA
jgi:hypothetical protein